MRRQRERARLTKRLIDAFTCPPDRKDTLLFDGDVTGFALRATASGSKIFLLQYKLGGRVVRLPLGAYGVLTVDQARALAQEARGRVSAGGDPLAERRAVTDSAKTARELARSIAKAETFTFKAMVDRWHKEHIEPKFSAGYVRIAVGSLHSLAAWQARPAHSITSAEATAALATVRKDRGPSAAAHAFRYGHAAFNWAVQHELVPFNPMTRAIRPEKQKARDRALTDSELGAIWRAAAKLEPPFSPLLRLLILTLQRRTEVAGMRWSEISEDLTLWTLPAARTKNAQRHIVHLTSEARAILTILPRFPNSDLVFTTTGKTGVSGFSKAKARLNELAAQERREAKIRPVEIPDWHLHDLRRTGVTTMARLGIPSDVADRILNHQASSTNSGVKGVYQVHSFAAEREEALRSWAIHVATIGAPLAKPGIESAQNSR